MIHKMNEIVKLIERYGLKTPSRKRELVYQRSYLYRQMQYQMTLQQIGKLFGKDHATVIHGIKVAKMFEHMKDEVYFHYIKYIREDYMSIMNDSPHFAMRKITYDHGTAIMYLHLPIDREIYEQMEQMDLNQFKDILECVNGV